MDDLTDDPAAALDDAEPVLERDRGAGRPRSRFPRTIR
jgi:hypothetical protein